MPKDGNLILGKIILERASMSSALITQAVDNCENMKDANDLFLFLFSEEMPSVEVSRLAQSETFSSRGVRASLGVTGEVVHSEGRDSIFYAVMDISDIVASHDPNKGFAKQENYPSEGQERPYHSDEGEQQKVKRNALRLEPRFLLTDNPDAINGPPVVTGSGIVMGGNSRTMSLLYAYENSPEKAELYKKELREKAKNFGIPPSEVDSYAKPILVRVAEGVDTKELAHRSRVYNQTFTQGLDTRAEGVSKGKLVTAKTVGILAQAIEAFGTIREYLNSGQSKLLINSLIEDGVIEETQLAKLTNKEGLLNEDGKRLVEGVLRGKAIDDFDLLNSVSPAMMQKIDRIIAPLSLVKARGEEWDITPKLKLALWQHVKFIASGAESPETFWNQRSLFDKDEDIKNDAMVEGLFLFMANAKPTEISKAWNRYANFAMSSVSGGIALPGIVLDTPESAFKKSFSGMIFESASDDHITGLLARSIVEANSKKELYTTFLGIFGVYDDAEDIAHDVVIADKVRDVCQDANASPMDLLWAKSKYSKIKTKTVADELNKDASISSGLERIQQASPAEALSYITSLGRQFYTPSKETVGVIKQYKEVNTIANDIIAARLDGDSVRAFSLNIKNQDALEAWRYERSKISNEIIKKIQAVSPISLEDAINWADTQVAADKHFLSKKNENVLKSLRHNLVNCYISTGGKLGPVYLGYDDKIKDRAYARGRRLICFQNAPSPNTVFHECGHLVEHNDEAINLVCQEFLRKRTEGAEAVPLGELAKGLKFKDTEFAKPDHFVNPYIGKIYPHGSTEVLSMGVECLGSIHSGLHSITDLLVNDPEHFYLTLGVCLCNNTYAGKEILDNAEDIDEDVYDHTKQLEWQKLIKKLGSASVGKKYMDSAGYKGFKIVAQPKDYALYYQKTTGEFEALFALPTLSMARTALAFLVAEKEGIIPNKEAKSFYAKAAYYARASQYEMPPAWFSPNMKIAEV